MISITKEVLIDHISSRYLKQNLDEKIEKISDILDLPISALKNAGNQEVDILKKNDIKTIRQLGKSDAERVEKIAKTTQIDGIKLENFYIACKLISRAWQKRAAYKTRQSTKLCVIGLDNAGKTTVIDLLSGKNLSDAVNQEPTIDVNRTNISSENLDFIMWDFAGQSDFRTQYTQNPEDYFLQIDVVVFIIDSQDAERYDEALIYFSRILETITFLGEKPYFTIMLHKSDPEFKDDPEFEINNSYIKEQIAEKMKTTGLQYEIISSSIYSSFQGQPKIVGFLKDTFIQEKDNPNLMLIDAIIKLTNNLFTIGERILAGQQSLMQLIQDQKPPQLFNDSESVTENIRDIEHVRPSDIARAAAQSDVNIEEGVGRRSILNELKDMFDKAGISSSD